MFFLLSPTATYNQLETVPLSSSFSPRKDCAMNFSSRVVISIISYWLWKDYG